MAILTALCLYLKSLTSYRRGFATQLKRKALNRPSTVEDVAEFVMEDISSMFNPELCIRLRL